MGLRTYSITVWGAAITIYGCFALVVFLVTDSSPAKATGYPDYSRLCSGVVTVCKGPCRMHAGLPEVHSMLC